MTPEPSPCALAVTARAPDVLVALGAGRGVIAGIGGDPTRHAAHLLARAVADARSGGGRAEIVHHCRSCGSHDHGRPALRGSELSVSLSHAPVHVGAVVGDGPVGIDVEDLARRITMRDLGDFLTAAERESVAGAPNPGERLLALWTRKEALVKTGAATLDDVHLVDTSPQVVRVAGERWALRTERRDGHVVSVVVPAGTVLRLLAGAQDVIRGERPGPA